MKTLILFVFALISIPSYAFLRYTDTCTLCMVGGAEPKHYFDEILKADSLLKTGHYSEYEHKIICAKLYNCLDYFYEYSDKIKGLLQEAIAIDSLNAEAYNVLANYFTRFNNSEKEYSDTSEIYLNKIFELGIQNGETYIIKAKLHFNKNEFSKSLDCLDSASTLGVCDYEFIYILKLFNFFCNKEFDKAFHYHYSEAQIYFNRFMSFESIATDELIEKDISIYRQLKRYFKKLPEDSEFIRYKYILDNYEKILKK